MAADRSLEGFLKQDYPNNANVVYNGLKVYVRKGRVYIDEKVKNAITRASTNNPKRSKNMEPTESPKSTGKYRALDNYMHEMAIKYGYDGVYVENVLNNFLGKKLEQYGYHKVNTHNEGPPCYYKSSQEEIKSSDIIIAHMGSGRLATTVNPKTDIPSEYKKYPVIGLGTTSVVLDAGDDQVIMLTRDNIKGDWLAAPSVNGLEIGNEIDSYERPHKIKEIGEMPISVIKMPKLYPLNKENRKAVKNLIAEWRGIRKPHEDVVRHFAYRVDEDHPLNQLALFLANYDEKQYHMDLSERNFMQDKDGKIVPVDPIVSSELIQAIHNHKNQAARTVYKHEPVHQDWWPKLGHDGEKRYLREHPRSKLKVESKMRDKIVTSDMGKMRIATTVSKKDIPEKYKKYPIIGMGTTCVVLDAGKDHVLMLTRDHIKTKWLTEGLKIGKKLDEFAADNPNPGVANIPVQVLKLKKLQPLDKENKKLAKMIVDEYTKEFHKHETKHKGLFKPKAQRMDPKIADQLTIRDTMKHFAHDVDAKHVFNKLAVWLQNYDPSKHYYDDIAERNFMQDSKGNILPVDQIVSKDLLDAIHEHQERAARVTHEGEKAAGKWWPELGKEGEKEYLAKHPKSKLKIAASDVKGKNWRYATTKDLKKAYKKAYGNRDPKEVMAEIYAEQDRKFPELAAFKK